MSSVTPVCDLIERLFDHGLSAEVIFKIVGPVERAIRYAGAADFDRRAHERNKKARLRATLPPGTTWPALRIEVFTRDKFVCQYCGDHVDDPHCDHFIPVILGGTSTLENLRTACPPCNLSKGDQLPEEWQGRPR